jgi:hypothetical protein
MTYFGYGFVKGEWRVCFPDDGNDADLKVASLHFTGSPEHLAFSLLDPQTGRPGVWPEPPFAAVDRDCANRLHPSTAGDSSTVWFLDDLGMVRGHRIEAGDRTSLLLADLVVPRRSGSSVPADEPTFLLRQELRPSPLPPPPDPNPERWWPTHGIALEVVHSTADAVVVEVAWTEPLTGAATGPSGLILVSKLCMDVPFLEMIKHALLHYPEPPFMRTRTARGVLPRFPKPWMDRFIGGGRLDR